MALDSRLAPALILLLGACDQVTQELDRADVQVEGLAAELEALSARLRDLLVEVA